MQRYRTELIEFKEELLKSPTAFVDWKAFVIIPLKLFILLFIYYPLFFLHDLLTNPNLI